MPTSEELTALMRAVATQRDRPAFAALFKHFAPRLKTYLMRGGSSDDEAEDFVQEAMVSVWRKAASFDPERAQVSTWIFTIARNLRVDQLRRGHDRHAGDDRRAAFGAADVDPLTQAVHDAPSPEEQLGAVRREAAVRQALRQLAPEQQQILWLSFYDEQSHARIADELNIPLGTVKSRIRLAVSHLRRLLQGIDS